MLKIQRRQHGHPAALGNPAQPRIPALDLQPRIPTVCWPQDPELLHGSLTQIRTMSQITDPRPQFPSTVKRPVRASIRNPERFGWNPERFGLKSSKIQRSPEIQNPSFKIQRSRRPWSNPKHGGGIQAQALSDPGVGMCDGFEAQITGLALNRPSDSRSLNPAGNSQLESNSLKSGEKSSGIFNYLQIQRLEIQLDPMIVHEC